MDVVQVDKSQKPKEKPKLWAVHEVSAMESSANTKDSVCTMGKSYKVSESTSEEPYVGKPPVRFCEGFHRTKLRI